MAFIGTIVFNGCRCGDPSPQPTPVKQTETEKPAMPQDLSKQAEGDPNAYKQAKRTYTVRLETTLGDIVIDVYRELAPQAADRFKTLVSAGFYNGSAFHEGHNGYLVRAGLSPNPMVNRIWGKKPCPNDPIIQRNSLGMVALHKSEDGFPCTEFIINLRETPHLGDTAAIPFGKVRGMQVADQIGFAYDALELPDPTKVLNGGANYLETEFPQLEYIVKASIVDEN